MFIDLQFSIKIERQKQLEEDRERNIKLIEQNSKKQALRVAIIADSIKNFECEKVAFISKCFVKNFSFSSTAASSGAQEANEIRQRLERLRGLQESVEYSCAVGCSRLYLPVEIGRQRALGSANQLVAEVQ